MRRSRVLPAMNSETIAHLPSAFVTSSTFGTGSPLSSTLACVAASERIFAFEWSRSNSFIHLSPSRKTVFDVRTAMIFSSFIFVSSSYFP